MKHLQFTVSEFNQIFANIVHHQLQLNKLCISGEITQFNYYNNKSHLYFPPPDDVHTAKHSEAVSSLY